MDDRGSKQRKGRAEKIREKKQIALQANAAKWFKMDHLFAAASRTSAPSAASGSRTTDSYENVAGDVTPGPTEEVEEGGGVGVIGPVVGWSRRKLPGPNFVPSPTLSAMDKHGKSMTVNRITMDNLLLRQYNQEFPEKESEEKKEMSCEERRFMELAQSS